jgi:pimeloyl-ACP methyl ester carboxylesterase
LIGTPREIRGTQTMNRSERQMNKTMIAALGLAITLAPAAAAAEPTTGYAPVNGLEMYYEVYGEGEPLVLLHGAYMDSTSWQAMIPALSETHQVIAVDLQAHGRTSDADRPLTYEGMADDVAALLAHLKVEKADVFGYSTGATVAVQIAVRHPEMVDQLIAASAWYSSEGFAPSYGQMIEGITPAMFAGTPMADDEGLPVLIEKLKTLDLTSFAFPDADVAAITAPTFLIFGDSDIVTLDHAVAMFKLLGGGRNGDMEGLAQNRLAILPASSHTAVAFGQTERLLDMVTEFLAGAAPKMMMEQ